MIKRLFSAGIAVALGLAASAHAACLPPIGTNGMPIVAASQNARGCWAGWWCTAGPGLVSPYVVAATKQQCSLVGVQRNVATWLMSPDPQALVFGSDPHADASLLAVWQPERAKLDAIKP